MAKNMLESAAKVTDMAATGLFRWVTTDHTGISQRLINMPQMGFLDTLRYILLQLVVSIVVAILTGALVFVVIAYGIPLLLFGHI
jgi:hypothetical protein